MSRAHRRSARNGYRHARRRGPVHRVTRGIADRLGVSRKLVLVAFVIGLILNLPLTVVVFLIALYWVDRPERLERGLQKTAGARPTPEPEDPDLQFRELRRQFAELERRAASMEAHVSSGEYRLDRELGGMRGGERR